MMSCVIIEEEVGATTVGITQRSSELDEELLYVRDICSWCNHVQLSTLKRFSNGTEQSYCAEVLQVLRSSDRRRSNLPSLIGSVPDLKGRLVHVDDLISVDPLETVELTSEGNALPLETLFGDRPYALHLFRLQVTDAVAMVDATECILAELDTVLSSYQLATPFC